MPWLCLVVAMLHAFLLFMSVLVDDVKKMPTARFAAIIARMLTYDTSLPGRAGASIDIAVLYRSGDAESTSEASDTAAMIRTLTKNGIGSLQVKTYSLAFADAAKLDRDAMSYGIDVFIVADALAEQIAAIKQVSTRRKITSIGRSSAQVRRGLAVALYQLDGKSKILVNLEVSKREGAAFSSDLLRLCEVIQ